MRGRSRGEGHRRRASVLLAVLAVLSSPHLFAAAPLVWELSPPPGVEMAPTRGPVEFEAIAVGADGSLTLAASARSLFPGEEVPPPPVVWAIQHDPKGNLWIGTGHSGGLVRLDARGGTADAFTSSQLGVHALAANSDGRIFAGTFPAGAVYRTDPGKDPEVWFEPEERYIWALLPDPSGALYVATGLHGIIYRVDGKSSGEVVLDADEAHVTSLALDASGHLLAGTDPGGRLMRLIDADHQEVILDSDLREISAILSLPDGTVYAAAISEEPMRPLAPTRGTERDALTIEVEEPGAGTVLEETGRGATIRIDLADLLPAPSREGEGAASRLYRIDPDGTTRVIWRSEDERILALAHDDRHGVAFGAGGPEGARIRRLEPDGTATLIQQLAEPQVTALHFHSDGRLYAGTANPGRVYVMDASDASSGEYLSRVIDAGREARWGTLIWDGDVPPGTRIEVMSRSGNTLPPDSSWSAWSPPSPATRGASISSPSARFLQWKASLSRLQSQAGPTLRNLRVTLLPRNRPPTCGGLRIMNRGAGRAGTGGEKNGGDPKKPVDPPAGKRWVTWDASDPDGDALVSSLWILPDGTDTTDRDRRLASDVKDPYWAWDDAALAEGRYRIRIETSDSPANGPAAMESSAISRFFLVDRTPPVLTLGSVKVENGRVRVEATAEDALGRIDKAEFCLGSTDSCEWTPLPCADGICDTSRETLLLVRDAPPGGTRLSVRVHDEAGNVTMEEIPGS